MDLAFMDMGIAKIKDKSGYVGTFSKLIELYMKAREKQHFINDQISKMATIDDYYKHRLKSSFRGIERVKIYEHSDECYYRIETVAGDIYVPDSVETYIKYLKDQNALLFKAKKYKKCINDYESADPNQLEQTVKKNSHMICSLKKDRHWYDGSKDIIPSHDPEEKKDLDETEWQGAEGRRIFKRLKNRKYIKQKKIFFNSFQINHRLKAPVVLDFYSG